MLVAKGANAEHTRELGAQAGVAFYRNVYACALGCVLKRTELGNRKQHRTMIRHHEHDGLIHMPANFSKYRRHGCIRRELYAYWLRGFLTLRHLALYLLTDKCLDRPKGIGKPCHVLAAGFCELRPATATSINHWRDVTNDIACLHSALNQVGCDHGE